METHSFANTGSFRLDKDQNTMFEARNQCISKNLTQQRSLNVNDTVHEASNTDFDQESILLHGEIFNRLHT